MGLMDRPSNADVSGKILYVLDKERILAYGDLVVEVWQQRSRDDKVLRPLSLDSETILTPSLPNSSHEPLDLLLICEAIQKRARRLNQLEPWSNCFVVDLVARERILGLLLETGRLFYRDLTMSGRLRPLRFDIGIPWRFHIEVGEDPSQECWEVVGSLERGDEEMHVAEPELVVSGGWILSGELLSRLQGSSCPEGGTHLKDHAFQWLATLRRDDGTFHVPKEGEQELLERLWSLPRAVEVSWPDSLELERTRLEPLPVLRVTRNKSDTREPARLRAVLAFFYDKEFVESAHPETEIPDVPLRRILVRDPEAESGHRSVLADITESTEGGLAPPPPGLIRRGVFEPGELELDPDFLPSVARRLVGKGWHVEAEGKLYKPPTKFAITVSSGIDWFDLGVEAIYGENSVLFPKLLRAMKSAKWYVVLGDGTFGVVPEVWLEEYRFLIATGRLKDGRLRFPKCQVGLLDRLVATAEDVTTDAAFDEVRSALRDSEGLRPEDPEGDFRGQLRPYQKIGLSWLRFLGRAGLGGCLADDMGLGKTIQVLALLEGRRNHNATPQAAPANGSSARQPSLVVAPPSLVFNWIAEAQRFTPLLRVLDHTGSNRVKKKTHLESYDLVVTTYGTMVRDIELLKKCRFGYAILDEAQAIKNPTTTFARAARVLGASHRLALTGTPIENHLGELWSLFEFLEPGLLGTASGWKKFVATEKQNSESLQLLSRALRPVILRRTKKEVADDLPDQVEQIIYCELEPDHRREYEKLRCYYLAKIRESTEIGGTIEVLKALLRLRQAACHPGLLDKSRVAESSSKVKVLLEQLEEILEEGNKGLVFSQFTALLGIVRRELDARGISYSYLDGSTRRRAEQVERFQRDPGVQLFLISLKAGGLGLNLTAAGYAFLLDPWWNPAVEAQAIARAHRIGQTRKIIAYRLITRGTIEERILELQGKKRRLAEEILGGERSLLRALKREDLELLLS